MKCGSCGAELKDGAANCGACGKPVGMGHRMGAETEHLAQKTGEATERLGKGLIGGVKSFGAGVKKELKGKPSEPKE